MLNLHDHGMAIQCAHSIVRHRDPRTAAVLLARILGLADPSQLGSMCEMRIEGSALRHTAFRLCAEELAQVRRHLEAHGLPFSQDAERALAFEAADGHLLHVITQPLQSCVTEISP